MKRFFLPFIALYLTSCTYGGSQYNPLYDEDGNCLQDFCLADESIEVSQHDPLDEIKETTSSKELLSIFNTQFEEKIKSEFNVIPLFLSSSPKANGMTCMLSTSEQIDIKAGRNLVLAMANILLEMANNQPNLDLICGKSILSVEDLDLFINVTNKSAIVQSISLLNGIIEYEGVVVNPEEKPEIKKEPFAHAAAKKDAKTCCGSYLIKSSSM